MHTNEIKQQVGKFFIQYSLVEEIDADNVTVTEVINDSIKRIINEKHLMENWIREVNVNFQREKSTITLDIDYYKYDHKEFQAMPVKEQIRTFFLKMGYAESAICKIWYDKRWKNSNDIVWSARINDSTYNELLREDDCTYACREYESSIMHLAKKVLGFTLYIDF